MLYFDEGTHTYLLDNRILTSVSTIVASQFRTFNARAVSKALTKKVDSQYFGMTQEAIMNTWQESGRVSRDLGIRLHYDIEGFYQHARVPDDPDRPDWRQFMAFVADHPEWKCVANELRVHNGKVAGTIDAVFSTPDGFVLVDWKRCKAMDYSGYGMGKDLMKHVPDCNYSKYSLQLSLYRHLIGVEIVECYIVQMHPELDTYQKIRAQNFYMEAMALLG